MSSASMRFRVVRRPFVLGLGALILLAGLATGAFAYYHGQVSGSGNGGASTTQMQTVTVAAFVGGDSSTTSLLPGTSADVILRASNPNTFSVTVYSVAANGSVVGTAGCPGTNLTFTAPASPVTPTVTLLTGSTLIHLPGAAALGTNAPNACQGVTFQIPVTLTVRR
jgi:hypothetical protein